MLTHSVTRTAEELRTSQPTASRFLAELEREIGFSLFDRSRGKLVPTHEAHALQEEVDRSFTGLTRIEKVAANIAAFRSERLRISSISSLAIGMLASAVPRFCTKYSGVEVALDVGSFEEVVNNVVTNQCEVGFVAYPVDRPGIIEDHLIRAHAVCVVPANHRLANLGEITPKEIGDTPFISLGHDIPSGQRIDQIFENAGIKRRMTIETQTAIVACALVEQEAGIAILDPFTAYAFRSSGIAIRPFNPAAPFEFRFILRSDRPPSRVTERFIAETRSWLAELPVGTFLSADHRTPVIRYQN